MSHLVGAIDQGTSSSRFLIFEANTGKLVTLYQTEIPRFAPKQGWVEQDADILLSSTITCIDKCVEKLEALGLSASQVKTIGITNQRETLIVWDKLTGKPLYNAIVWMDTRALPAVEENLSARKEECEKIRRICGLPMSTYFSALKLKWLLDNVPEVRNALKENRCLFESDGRGEGWPAHHGCHQCFKDHANELADFAVGSLLVFFGIDKKLLPEIRSSSEIYGHLVSTKLANVPISGILGDQQAAMVGQLCLKPGEAKCTYGTGCFLLFNTGEKIVHSTQGLLTTVGYKFGKDQPVVYALEGSVAITGACIRWLRDNLAFGEDYEQMVQLADSVDNTGGVYFIPAFSGLFAPYWQSGARGLICGLTEFSTKAHITRAAYEAVAFQVKDILDAMNNEVGVVPLSSLRVDGGMTVVESLMRLQADFLGIETLRAKMPETSALGAAMAAGFAKGVDVWNPFLETESMERDAFHPTMGEKERRDRHANWKIAVTRSF
ncbi:putative glycerol kinase 3 [Folsomia candida]|uniref:glycerol kinase n=1 Tax=Folsomia candida TaxID=158441 RepID=A0A226F0I7_FOLCA|nr:putative glycerol kinase 3 [Folsomia candida]